MTATAEPVCRLMSFGQALTKLEVTDLERLLRALHRGELTCPIEVKSLHVAGLSYLVDRVDFLARLDAVAVRAVLVAVLAERRRGPRALSSGPTNG